MLTKQEAIEEHRKMWLWITTETIRLKRKVNKLEYLRHFNYDWHSIKCFCFCCEYDRQMDNGENYHCEFCPIDWNSNMNIYMCLGKYKEYDSLSLYGEWITTSDYKKAALIAYKISNLPERKL